MISLDTNITLGTTAAIAAGAYLVGYLRGRRKWKVSQRIEAETDKALAKMSLEDVADAVQNREITVPKCYRRLAAIIRDAVGDIDPADPNVRETIDDIEFPLETIARGR